jgi:glucose-1-phosphate thymidylyltransferase
MKGVILAGGKGTRLYPLTSVINKHLLPIYNKPMIFYPIQTLINLGCKQILIVTGGENTGEFMNLIKDGKELGLETVYYAFQTNPTGGIADALKLARNFIGQEKFCMMLGDNLILDELNEEVEKFKQQPYGTSRVFIKKIENPTSFGVAEVENDLVIDIVEKPKEPKTDLAVVGLYMYDNSVFDIIDTIKPSTRGELEITTVNQIYASQKKLYYSILEKPWIDTGSIESLFRAQEVIKAFNK